IRKAVRDVVRADQDLDVDPEIVGMAEDLGDAPLRAIPVGAEVENLGGDDHAVQVFDGARLDRARANAMNPSALSRQRRARRNLDPLPEALVMRHHEITLAANAE